jgi:alpha-beta hydrolase superfamily lysophospholipase
VLKSSPREQLAVASGDPGALWMGSVALDRDGVASVSRISRLVGRTTQSMRTRSAALLAAGVLVCAGGTAVAGDPAPGTPQWYAAEAENWSASTGRVQDQLSNPEYAALRAEQADSTNADPYRAPEKWAPARGRVWAVAYRNRYGARISGHIWAPRPNVGRAPYPAVVMVNGSGDSEEEYWSFGEDLAEHGYVVLTFDPQGAGKSDTAPAAPYCDPKGAWRKPQEMGVTEHGSCAGENGDEVSATTGELPGVADLVVTGHTGQQGTLDVQSLYEQLEPNFVFGALDARDFLVSRASPVHAMVDRRRVAVMGHSLGAYAAALTANGDPKHRFAVGVSLDAYAHLGHGVGPRVPTLYLQSEQEFFAGPRFAPPPPTSLHATRVDYPRYVHTRVPVFYAVLAGSTHQEFAYVGPEAHLPASAAGQRVATYFALAWLDRWLKSDATADRRLLAAQYDTSVDRSAIGAGHWNPATQQNEPHHLAGVPVRDTLSRYYLSEADFDRHHCPELRQTDRCR